MSNDTICPFECKTCMDKFCIYGMPPIIHRTDESYDESDEDNCQLLDNLDDNENNIHHYLSEEFWQEIFDPLESN